jgi:hypothetical protein
MKKEQIENMIDKKIENKFSTGSVVNGVIYDLNIMKDNIAKVLKRDGFTIEDYKDVKWEDIDKVRVKYAVHYIKHCKKRISDMTWISEKKGSKIAGRKMINYWEIWKFFKFREMITNSKAKVDIRQIFERQLKNSFTIDEKSIELEKNWSNGEPKKVGQKMLRAFLKNGERNHTMVTLPESDLDKYEVDEYYCEKIGMDKIFMPYIIKKVVPNQQLLLPSPKTPKTDEEIDELEKVVKFHQFD